MGLMDNIQNSVRVQLQSQPGTSKYGWLESLSEFLTFSIVVALAIKQGWYIPAGVLAGTLIAMIVVMMKN